MQEAIRQQIEKGNSKSETEIDELLKDVSINELRAFISRKAKHNDDFRNSVFLEFSQATEKKNIYSSILQDALSG